MILEMKFDFISYRLVLDRVKILICLGSCSCLHVAIKALLLLCCVLFLCYQITKNLSAHVDNS